MACLLNLPCQYLQCTQPVVAHPAFCYGCDKVLCRDHLDSLDHQDCRETCTTLEKWDQTFEDAANDLDLDALKTELGTLRPGHTHEITMPDIAEIDEECHGGQNIHIPILFDDGVEWILRLNGYDRGHPPFGVLEYKRRSEVATMMALQTVTNLVPRVYSWGIGKLSKTKDPRCLYIVSDKKPGRACEAVFEFTKDEEEIPQATKLKFIEDYADFCVRVSNLSYDSMGSLDLDGDAIKIGPMIDLYGGSNVTAPYFPGPFKSMRDRYIAHIDRVLSATRKGLMGKKRPLLVYLAHLVARDLVMNDAEMAKEDEKFYIRQRDALAGQFLVQDGGITAVLDWEFANTTCKTHAFSAIETIFGTGAWLCGDNALTEGEIMLCKAYEQRGRDDLADCVKNGRKFQRLEYVIENVLLFMYRGRTDPWLVGTLNGMVEAFLGEKAGPLPTSSEDWTEWALARHANDPGLGEIMKLEGEKELYTPEHLLLESEEAGGVDVETVMPSDSAGPAPLAVQ